MAFLEDSERVVSFLGQSEGTRAHAQDPVHLRTELGDNAESSLLGTSGAGEATAVCIPFPKKILFCLLLFT